MHRDRTVVLRPFHLAFTLAAFLTLMLPVRQVRAQITAEEGRASNAAPGQELDRQEQDRQDLDRQEQVPGKLSRIEQLLVDSKFDELDHLASTARLQKTREIGGDWKLKLFYTELDRPMGPDQGSLDHLARLQAWVKTRPESITARVALANSYGRWAWVARGTTTIDKVTPEGIRLYEERTQLAAATLEAATRLKTMCPEWFLVQMNVARDAGWSKPQMQQLFERAVQFEPEYYYFYRNYANYLLPKWYGAPGESAQLATSSADALGGDRGDLLYYQIVSNMVRAGNGDVPPKQFDWQRAQRGYTALQAAYGVTRGERNKFAFMAWKYKDAATAGRQFALIGDDWSRGVWRTRATFDRARDWALAQNQTASLQQGR